MSSDHRTSPAANSYTFPDPISVPQPSRSSCSSDSASDGGRDGIDHEAAATSSCCSNHSHSGSSSSAAAWDIVSLASELSQDQDQDQDGTHPRPPGLMQRQITSSQEDHALATSFRNGPSDISRWLAQPSSHTQGSNSSSSDHDQQQQDERYRVRFGITSTGTCESSSNRLDRSSAIVDRSELDRTMDFCTLQASTHGTPVNIMEADRSSRRKQSEEGSETEDDEELEQLIPLEKVTIEEKEEEAPVDFNINITAAPAPSRFSRFIPGYKKLVLWLYVLSSATALAHLVGRPAFESIHAHFFVSPPAPAPPLPVLVVAAPSLPDPIPFPTLLEHLLQHQHWVFVLVMLGCGALRVLRSSILFQRRSSPKSSSPPPFSRAAFANTPAATVAVRALMVDAERAYRSGNLRESLALFEKASDRSSCGHSTDRSKASEWAGETMYQLAMRNSGECRKDWLSQSLEAYGKALRWDRSAPRARSVNARQGRSLYQLGQFAEAEKRFADVLFAGEGAEQKGGFVFEFYGKAMLRRLAMEDSCDESKAAESSDGQAKFDDARAALGKRRRIRMERGESFLLRAIALDQQSYTALAFLGEHYHASGRMSEAVTLLDRAVQLRNDYPAALVRLAIIATEVENPTLARRLLREALHRQSSGLQDADLYRTLPIMESSTIYLALYFVTPSHLVSLSGATTRNQTPVKKEGDAAQCEDEYLSTRRKVLEEAATMYSSDWLVNALLAIELRRSKLREDTERGARQLRKIAIELGPFELERRSTANDEDPEKRIAGKGVLALTLLELGEVARAGLVYRSFQKLRSSHPAVGGAYASSQIRSIHLGKAYLESKNRGSRSSAR